MVTLALLRAAVGIELHAPRGLEVVCGLGGVADDEADGVPAGDGERVAALVVVDEPDELLELVELEARGAFVGREVDRRVAHPLTVGWVTGV